MPFFSPEMTQGTPKWAQYYVKITILGNMISM